jgi:hypothetical protein
MRRQLILAIALFCAAAGQAEGYDLSEHEWRHRLLFLVAPHAEDADLQKQQRDIALRSDAVLDRELIVFQLIADQGLRGETPLTPEAVGALRRQLDVAAEERQVILIGKDGGIKRRAGLDADLRDVFRQIDAMPMRRQEMRAKTEAGIPVTRP